jgi:hypothetical protein
LSRFGLNLERHDTNNRNGESLEAQFARFNQYSKQANEWWESGRSLARKIDLPDLPRINWPSSGMSIGTMPAVNAPRPSVPEMAEPPDGTALIWLTLSVVLGLILWKILSPILGIHAGKGNGWTLGPWPVQPAAVGTRGELVRAFEYLSLLHFGPVARNWNHRTIAEKLGGTDEERRRAAGDLAQWYELARYAPVEEPLTNEALTAARRDLCFLAGVAAS